MYFLKKKKKAQICLSQTRPSYIRAHPTESISNPQRPNLTERIGESHQDNSPTSSARDLNETSQAYRRREDLSNRATHSRGRGRSRAPWTPSSAPTPSPPPSPPAGFPSREAARPRTQRQPSPLSAPAAASRLEVRVLEGKIDRVYRRFFFFFA